MASHTFEPTRFHPTIGSHEPVLRIKDGDTVVTWCVDAGGHDREFKSVTPGGNPQTGPFYVEGAEPGDTLAVRIVSIEPTRDWAVSAFIPSFGGLTSTRFTRTLQEPLPERVWVYRLENEVLTCTPRLSVG